ncbi:MAG: M24 family metallopeptidase, partial [Bacillota bacterium]
GVDVHEAPFLAPGEEAVLEEGMTFTVEPSIITPDGHVIRAEDVVLVTPSGGESLTSSPRDPVVV